MSTLAAIYGQLGSTNASAFRSTGQISPSNESAFGKYLLTEPGLVGGTSDTSLNQTPLQPRTDASSGGSDISANPPGAAEPKGLADTGMYRLPSDVWPFAPITADKPDVAGPNGPADTGMYQLPSDVWPSESRLAETGGVSSRYAQNAVGEALSMVIHKAV